jgi:3-oxoacyl-[acyl-carrier-protein] synthase-3
MLSESQALTEYRRLAVRYFNVRILSVAHVDAPEHVSSEELESRLAPALRRFGVSPGLLKKLSGIESRRMFDPAYLPSEGASEAANRAIGKAGIDGSELGVVVNTSVCRDDVEPSTASIVHRNLKLSERCQSFDLGNACLAFLNGMEVVSSMIERGQIEYGIVVNCENTHFAVLETIKRLLDPRTTWSTFRDNFATLTLGSFPR